MSDPAVGSTDHSEARSGVDARRARVIDAFIDLVLEGHTPPASEQVAARAGISMATLFRYFDTLDELRRDAAVRTYERFRRHFEIPAQGEGLRAERIARFAASRVGLWEAIHPLALLARSNARVEPGDAEVIAIGRRGMVEQIRRHFDAELRAFTPAHRDAVVATIATLSSVESWDQFRHAYGRSALQTRRAWVHTIDRILDEG